MGEKQKKEVRATPITLKYFIAAKYKRKQSSASIKMIVIK